LRILVTFALDAEFAPWRRLRAFQRLTSLPCAAYEAIMPGGNLRAILTGMGPVHARRAICGALAWNPDVCISTGLAGSLRPAHRVGQIFVARNVVELETGRSISADASLFANATSRGAAAIDRLVSSQTLIASGEGKSRLSSMADAVDMESFAVLEEARARHIPAIAIRAISDSAREKMPLDFSAMLNAEGQVEHSKLAFAIARAPQKLPGLVRLGRNSRRAAAALAAFLDAYVQDLARSVSHLRVRARAEAVRA
jgi:adenosylhomocysteine nucleosidase